MDLNNIYHFNPLLKQGFAYMISNFFCEPTKKFQQTLENPVSLKFRKITSVAALQQQESEFPKHHFEFVTYNQLYSRLPNPDENSRTIYPMLADYMGCIRSISDIIPYRDPKYGLRHRRLIDVENLNGNVIQLTLWDDLTKHFNREDIQKLPFPIMIVVSGCRVTKYTDVQLTSTPATFYYINPRTPEVADAHKMFKEKYDMKPLLEVCRYRFDDPELEKTWNRQTLQTLLEQEPTSFQGVWFTCEAMVTSVNTNRSWSYSSCCQCSKTSTKRSGIYVCENHGVQDPPTYRYNFKAAVTDGTASAEFTFFTKASKKITRNSCSYLMEKHNPTSDGTITVGMTPKTSALTLDKPRQKDEVPGLQIISTSYPTLEESSSKMNEIPGQQMPQPLAVNLGESSKKEEVPGLQLITLTVEEPSNKPTDVSGTPPSNMIEMVAETIVSTIPQHPVGTYSPQKAALPPQPQKD